MQMDTRMRSKIEKISSSVVGYATIMDVGVQHNPALSAMVWGTMRLLSNVRASRSALFSKKKD